ncbi:MAG: carboxyl-terminal processing protease CtpC [Cyanobacteria bacterium P01_G01_bin.54]
MALAKRGLVLSATAFVLTTIAVTGAGLHLSQGQMLGLNSSPKELIDEVWQIINRNYVDATFNGQDWIQLRSQYLNETYSQPEDAYAAIEEMLGVLEDPYTRFMDPKEFQDMQIDTSGSLTGVGIQITKHEESDRLVVVSPIEDSPAFSAGVIAQDIIYAIDGQDTLGMDINEAVQLIRGEKGTEVTLTIWRDSNDDDEVTQNEKIDFPIVRDDIEIHPVRTRRENTAQGTVAYIRLTQFNANAARDMQTAIEESENPLNGQSPVVGYVLDLRSNPGGLLYSSVEIARMWLDRGVIVTTSDRRGEVDRQEANNRALTDKPVVVIVDGGSASASEILAGALQDNNRAQVVGTQTFGKGLVQSVRRLGNGAGLAVTIAKYRTPSGQDIHETGITPDVVVEMTEAQQTRLRENNNQIGTLDDPQFKESLEILLEEIRVSEGIQIEALAD